MNYIKYFLSCILLVGCFGTRSSIPDELSYFKKRTAFLEGEFTEDLSVFKYDGGYPSPLVRLPDSLQGDKLKGIAEIIVYLQKDRKVDGLNILSVNLTKNDRVSKYFYNYRLLSDEKKSKNRFHRKLVSYLSHIVKKLPYKQSKLLPAEAEDQTLRYPVYITIGFDPYWPTIESFIDSLDTTIPKADRIVQKYLEQMKK